MNNDRFKNCQDFYNCVKYNNLKIWLCKCFYFENFEKISISQQRMKDLPIWKLQNKKLFKISSITWILILNLIILHIYYVYFISSRLSRYSEKKAQNLTRKETNFPIIIFSTYYWITKKNIIYFFTILYFFNSIWFIAYSFKTFILFIL